MEWVLINKVVDSIGYTRNAIYSKKKNGIWIFGIHWKKAPDGHLIFNLVAIQQWLQSK